MTPMHVILKSAISLQLQPKQKKQKIFPSPSLASMMKLRKVITESLEIMEFKVKEFYLDSMTWNDVRDSIKFSVNKENFTLVHSVMYIKFHQAMQNLVMLTFTLVKGEGTEFVTIERMIKGQFKKYMNNDG